MINKEVLFGWFGNSNHRRLYVDLGLCKTLPKKNFYCSLRIDFRFCPRTPGSQFHWGRRIIVKWLGEYNHEDINISDILPGHLVRKTSGQYLLV